MFFQGDCWVLPSNVAWSNFICSFIKWSDKKFPVTKLFVLASWTCYCDITTQPVATFSKWSNNSLSYLSIVNRYPTLLLLGTDITWLPIMTLLQHQWPHSIRTALQTKSHVKREKIPSIGYYIRGLYCTMHSRG